MRGKKKTEKPAAKKSSAPKLKAQVETAKLKVEKRAYQQAGKIMAVSYRGAQSTRLSTSWKFSESLSGVPKITPQDQRAMRDRSRQLERDNPIAQAILNRLTENVVGSGFKIQPLTVDEDWNKQAHSLMHSWFTYADFLGLSWLEHQRLAFRSEWRDGDVGSILIGTGETPQLQLIESDYITTDPEHFTPNCYDGVQADQYGRASAYYVMTVAPTGTRTWKRITAKNFVLLKNSNRIGQLRGVPGFSSCLELFDSISGYIDAVILAQRIAACFAIFIKQESAAQKVSGLNYQKNAQGQQQRQVNLEPGLVQSLNPGESIEQIKPEQPGAGFPENLRVLLRLLGTASGLPLELVLGDYSQTNYAASRAARLDASITFAYHQQHFCESYLSRVYRWRISKFIKAGLLKDREDKFAHRWIGPAFQYLNPIEQHQADQLSIDSGFMTQEEILLSKGKNPADHLRVRALELEAQRELKIPIYRSSLVAQVIENPTAGQGESPPQAPQGNTGGNEDEQVNQAA
jgi:lambda family phage portal protein